MKTLRLIGVSAVLLAACNAGEHEAEVDELNAWSWAQDPTERSHAHVSAPRVAGGKATAVAPLSFLALHEAQFGIRDPDAELRVSKVDRDSLGMSHVRMQQQVHGIAVIGGEVVAHYDAGGAVTSVDTSFIRDVDVALEPAISAATALATARAAVATTSIPGDLYEATTPQLIVFAVNGHPPTLAYASTLRSHGERPARLEITIDARTGRVIDLYDNLQTIQGSGVGALGDTKSLEVSTDADGFSMIDTSRGAPIRTFTAGGAELGVDGALLVRSPLLTSWDTSGPGAGSAVDAHAHAAIIYDYYKQRHGRLGIDGADGPLLSVVHFGRSYDNAFWDGTEMAYGDGGLLFRPLAAALDVAAHEITHGVTEKTSGLRYAGQSGALNEAVSDIFGAFVEHTFQPDDVKNWQCGEAVALSDVALRDFRDPRRHRQPAHFSNYVNTQQDAGGVHTNSGIVNQAAFLMTAGGTNPVSGIQVGPGIGWEKSEQLWYRANTKYFMSTTTFAQAAADLGEAAADLGFTAEERNTVYMAWVAVGIGPSIPPRVPSPPRGDPPHRGFAGEDSAPALGPVGTRDTRAPSAGCIQSGGSPAGGPLSLVAAALALTFGILRRRLRARVRGAVVSGYRSSSLRSARTPTSEGRRDRDDH